MRLSILRMGNVPVAISLAALVIGLASGTVRAQSPTIDTTLPPTPGGNQSSLGASPGAGAGGFTNSPGADQGILGGRAGTGTSRAPADITTPGGMSATPRGRMTLQGPPALPAAEIPVYGSLDFPSVADDEGPADGMTLDRAIELLVSNNLYLKGVLFEIPQADADILTASLRANPVFYADSQLIPYGQYTRARPGGQTQYDVNISYPLDVSRKRRARINSSTRAKRVLEQQYRDAVRLQIDNLYTVYVDVLASRATLRYSEASVQGLDAILVPINAKVKSGASAEDEALRVILQRERAEIGRRDAEQQVLKNKKALANLLNISPEQADSIELRASLKDTAPIAPPEDVLVRLALDNRPDLAAYRLGVSRAEADVKLALANRYSDIYVLYQPYTFQDNTPNGLKSSHSWALGLTVPLPLYNRNQGNIMRARLNVDQSQTQLVGQIRQVITDVQQAEREYQLTRATVERFETVLAPAARRVLQSANNRRAAGSENLIIYLAARSEFVAIVKEYLDSLVRHRRSMLDLNTAVGERLLP